MSVSKIEAGRQRSGWLWYTVEEVCSLLDIRLTFPVSCDNLLFQRVHFKAGQHVYRTGHTFDNLYVVNTGFLKIVQFDQSDNEQVLSFPMRGDLIGVDGIDTRQYMSEAVALSDCDLVVLPFKTLSRLGHLYPDVENMVYRIMSRELMRRQASIGMLSTMSAEARVARFLVSLSERFAAMGYSCRTFNLRMTRQEIGSHLGLTLETVSRTVSGFAEAGLITIHQRAVNINDLEALKALRRQPSSRSHAKYGAPGLICVARRR
ncbi:Crp/Fnr family transcriptional regulator [Massilia sp. GCM10023247]|uniref:Crp/Fnr family transcriptional regulator n=1 Tax=Massilia sp. GCM10023247 TaxID=3252643 RepID=UPI00360FA1A3